jgi:hypothetical protein
MHSPTEPAVPGTKDFLFSWKIRGHYRQGKAPVSDGEEYFFETGEGIGTQTSPLEVSGKFNPADLN